MNNFKYNEAGVCPLCGSTLLDYDAARMNGMLVRPWTCPDCGASGSETHEVSFLEHIDVLDKDGNVVEDTSASTPSKIIKSYSYSLQESTDDDGEPCKAMTIFIHTTDGNEFSIADITMGLDNDEDYIKEVCEETIENYGYEFEEVADDEAND